MLSLQVLIPTYDKNLEEIKGKCSFWNLETDALISVQSDHDGKNSFLYKNHTITVIFNKTRGVSINRNILLDNCLSDIGVFIDDDCSMISGYSYKIISFYEEKLCDCACFNGFLPKKDENVLIHDSRTKKVTLFHDVSSVGAPGFSAKMSFLKLKGIRFDENLGTPNFIVAGEDSFFIKNIYDSRCSFYRSSQPIFKIEEDITNSSYFNGFNDYRFLITKGYVAKKIYNKFFSLIKYIYCYKLSKRNGLKISTNLKLFCIGASLTSEKGKKKICIVRRNQDSFICTLEKNIEKDLYFRLIALIYSQKNDVDVDNIILKYKVKENEDNIN